MGLLESLSERSGRLSDDMTELSTGGINPLQMGLRAAGETAGGVGDVVGAAVEPLIPDFILEGIQAVAEGAINSPMGKIAQKWMEDNPEQARDIISTFNIGSLMGGGALGKGATKGAITKAAHNAPNQLGGFYGSGAVGQLGSVLKGVPSTLGHMAKDAFTPSGQASFREGIPSRLKSVAKEKVGLIDKGIDVNKNAGFLEGQMDQSSLLHHGAGTQPAALNEIFRPMQEISSGPMNSKQLAQGVAGYKPQQYKGMGLDKPLMDNMMDNIRGAQKIKPGEDVVMVNRHPTALTDIIPESTGGAQASKTAKRLFRAKKAMGDYFPEKQKFDNIEDLKEFVAVRSLVDDTKVRADGSPMTKADKVRSKLVGDKEFRSDNDKYRPREKGGKIIDDYFKFKKIVQEGPKFTAAEMTKLEKLREQAVSGKLSKTGRAQLDKFNRRKEWGELSPQQIEKFQEYTQRVEKGKKHLKVGDDGRVYVGSSHRSAAKGLGGVNDQFAIDMNGNITHILDDENDLFGLKLPGDKRVVSVTPPKVYNIFRPENNPADKVGSAAKKAHAEMLSSKYGATNKGTKGAMLSRQMGEAIMNHKPQVGMGDYMNAARNYGRGGLLAALGAYDEERDK